ncbi:MAG TPA: RDD family protein [Pedococcus sp.]
MSTNGASPLPAEARPYQRHRAGVVSRAVAGAIDALLVGLVLLLGYAGFASLLFLLDPRTFSFPEPGLFFSLTAAMTVLVVYLTGSWWITGRTYGSHVMGLRVVSYNGSNLRLAGALLRALFCAFFPIGLLWAAVNRENRSLQDIVLRTSVLYDWQPRG